MKIDWSKVKEGFTTMDLLKEENKELKEELEYTIPIVEHNKTITKHLKEIERLNNIIKTKDEGIKAFTEDLCEESTKIEKAIEYIKKHTYHDKPKKLQNGIYERGILLIKSDFDIEEVLGILQGVDKN